MASPTWYVFAPGSVIMQGMTDEGNFGCHFNPAVSLASTVFLTGAEHYLVTFPILCRQSRSMSQCCGLSHKDVDIVNPAVAACT